MYLIDIKQYEYNMGLSRDDIDLSKNDISGNIGLNGGVLEDLGAPTFSFTCHSGPRAGIHLRRMIKKMDSGSSPE